MPFACSDARRGAWKIRDDSRYLAEPKLDGQRAQIHIRHGRTAHAFSRPGRELIRRPGLAWLREIRWPVASAILDGEVVAGDGSEGIQAGFEARSTVGSPMAFAAFDMIRSTASTSCGSRGLRVGSGSRICLRSR